MLLDQDFEFFAPEYALEEVNRNMSEILKKTRMPMDKFKELRRNLGICVEFIPLKEYSEFLDKVQNISNKEDVDFVALALKLKLPLWSNDKGMKKQSLVKIYSTSELIKKLK
jgi:predicted nucleic acid-binding protein